MRRAFLALVFVIATTAAEAKVILLSGLFDFSSIYVSALAARLSRCTKVIVRNHSVVASLVGEAKGADFIIGHSMGGLAAAWLAGQAGHKVTLITLDPGPGNPTIPPNVIKAVNIYQPVGLGGGHGFGARDIRITGTGHTGVPSYPLTMATVAGIVCGKPSGAKQ